MSDPKHYVLGFAFNSAKDHIVLIYKNRPDWQAGKINGIGGKVERGEIPVFSMEREFFEETGVVTHFHNWKQFATLIFGNDILGGKALIHCFKFIGDECMQASTYEDEDVETFAIKDIWDKPLIGHLHFLIPMAMDDTFKYADLHMQS